MNNRRKWCLIGIPDHEGVINIGGRIGAAGGPLAFSRIFDRMTGREGVQETLLRKITIEGISRNVEENHLKAAETIRSVHQDGLFSVVVGGGHDHGFSHLKGIQLALEGKKLGCINLDAHLDVRKPDPRILSGSPFYLALETGILDSSRFVEFGIQDHCNHPNLWNYVMEKGIHVVSFSQLRFEKSLKTFQKTLKRMASRCDSIVISFDLDCVAEAYAPGVSAPQSEGFSSSEVIEMMEIAGRERKVVSLGIFELNPEHDQGDRTARLAATCAYHFVAERLSS